MLHVFQESLHFMCNRALVWGIDCAQPNWENEFSWLVYDEDINGVFFTEFVNRPQQKAPHSIQEVFGSQNRSRIGRKLPREWKLMKEVASTLKPVKPC